MSFTLSQFKSALNNGGVQANVEAKVVEAKTAAGKAITKTADTTLKAGSAIKGIMPATNKKVDTIAAKFNKRLNDVEMNQRVTDVKLSMIAQATGIEFPTDEEIIEELVDADNAEKTEAVVQAFTSPELINMLGMFSEKLFGVNPFATKPGVDEDEDDDIYELEDESLQIVEENTIPEAVKEKTKVKKPKVQPKVEEEEEEGLSAPVKQKSGRKKLGRQAPLAD